MNTAKLITAGLLLAISGAALADSVETSPYKMVVISDIPGVDAIQSGDIAQGLAIMQNADIENYSRNLNLCVGYTKLSQFEDAEKACTKAVYSASHSSNEPDAELRAYAYNNRGVMKLMANDNLGALEDFKRAAKAAKNQIYKHNLARLETALNGADVTSF